MPDRYPLARIQFVYYTVKRIDFELNPALRELQTEEFDLDFKLTQSVSISEDFRHATVELSCEVFPQGEKLKGPFHLFTSLEGYFDLDADPNGRDELKHLVATNTVAILFPYLRSVVTAITAAANLNPLILPTINVAQWLNSDQSQPKT